MVLKDWKKVESLSKDGMSLVIYDNSKTAEALAVGIWEKGKSDFGVVSKSSKGVMMGDKNKILLPHSDSMSKALAFAKDYMRTH
jgi:hypothetical protein